MTDLGDVAPNSTDRIAGFLTACAHRLRERGRGPAARRGSMALDEALARSTPLEFQPGWLDALETLPLVEPTPLGRQFAEVARLLPWTPTHRADDGGVDLALAPLEQARDLGDLVAGIMYVRPGRQYPLHHHPPNELYLTLAGHARWRFGGNDEFQMIGPDTVLHNRPGDLHSAIAGETPLVAFYVLWT